MENVLTDYLIKNNWTEVCPLSYKKPGSDIEIFFDTSNQIEVYNKTGQIKTAYIVELGGLMKVLDELSI